MYKYRFLVILTLLLGVFVYLQGKTNFFFKSKAYDSNNIIEFGKVETVFDYSSNYCPGEPYTFPDMTAKAFVDATGTVQLIAGNSDPNRRFIGSNLSDLKYDCGQPIMKSEFNTDVTKSRDYSWIMSPYVVETAPNLPVVALVHNEFHGYLDGKHGNFTNCIIKDPTNMLKCWWGSVNLAISYNNGATYTQSPSPSHIVSSIGFNYQPNNKDHYGAMEPSNIVYRSGYYYSLVTVQSPIDSQPYVKAGTCLMRTNNLLDAKSWRYYDGSGFSIPAENATNCKAVLPTGWSLSLTFNSYLNQYVSFGCQWQSSSCMRFSSDLINWSNEEVKLNANGYYVYGSMLQPGDFTRNFEVSGRSPWFYYVACGNGLNANECGPDRDLKRVRVRFSKLEDIGKYPLLDLQFNELKGSKTLDSSFYVNDGTFSGNAKLGISDTRFARFEGSGAITIPHSNSLSITNTFSIKMRIKTSMIPASTNYPTLINKPSISKRNFGLFMTPTGLVHFSMMNGSNFAGTVSKQRINDGLWHEIIVVFDQPAQKISYYIDGKLDSTQTQLGKLSDGVNNGSLVIGSDGFKGDIDYLGIYNYALK